MTNDSDRTVAYLHLTPDGRPRCVLCGRNVNLLRDRSVDETHIKTSTMQRFNHIIGLSGADYRGINFYVAMPCSHVEHGPSYYLFEESAHV